MQAIFILVCGTGMSEWTAGEAVGERSRLLKDYESISSSSSSSSSFSLPGVQPQNVRLGLAALAASLLAYVYIASRPFSSDDISVPSVYKASRSSSLFVLTKSFEPIRPPHSTESIEDGVVSNLAGHSVDCSEYENGQSFLRSFEYDKEAKSIRYACSVAPDPYPDLKSREYQTKWTPDADGTTASLMKHGVYCPIHALLTEWHLEREELSENIRMVYKCVSPTPAVECVEHRDPNFIVGFEPGEVNTLGNMGQPPHCADDSVLQGWSLMLSPTDKFYYEYTCCKVGRGFGKIGNARSTKSSEDGPLMNLGLQEINCNDIRKSSSPINSFQYNASFHSYYYYCALSGVGMNPQPPQGYTSQWAEIGTSGDLTDLKALKVDCPDGSLLMEFKLDKKDEKTIRYNYQCLSYHAATISCRAGYTPFTDKGKEFSLDALEQHIVGCNINEALNSFQIQQNGQNLAQFRYQFECCTATVPSPPSALPTSLPTESSTTLAPISLEPTAEPSSMPIAITSIPTLSPTAAPTKRTHAPIAPTFWPTKSPTIQPTPRATQVNGEDVPEVKNIQMTSNPTLEPTLFPSASPTVEPSLYPTLVPTVSPTQYPTSEPVARITKMPTPEPTMTPTTAPSMSDPTLEPTNTPIAPPSFEPTQVPLTQKPTLQPTVYDTQIENIKRLENVIPQDRRGYDVVMRLFGNDTEVWKYNCRICPFTFVKGKSYEARADGCALLATGKVDMMDPGKTTPAAYICTDIKHSMKLDTTDLLQIGFRELGAEGRNWESGSSNEEFPGITTIVAAEDVAIQGYYDRGFVNPIPSAENDDGVEKITEENEESKQNIKNELTKREHTVNVVKQLSEVPCELNVNFGIVEGKDNYMFVDKGCHAQFESNDGALLFCMSLDFRYTECEIPFSAHEVSNMRMEEIEMCRPVLKEELSTSICECGINFGMIDADANSDSMWASDGCRGIFLSPDSTVVWNCLEENIEYTLCKNGREAGKRARRYLLESASSSSNSSVGVNGNLDEGVIKKEADSLNEDFENRWEFDPDKIVGENDQVMSLTMASRLAVRTSPFPDVCGGSDVSAATIIEEVAEAEKAQVVERVKKREKQDPTNPDKLFALSAKEQMNLRGAPLKSEQSYVNTKPQSVHHKVRKHNL